MSVAAKIIAGLKKKDYQPIYFLCGSEPYFIDEVTQYIEKNVLDEAQKGFDQTILYGKEIEMSDIIETAKRYPMLSDYQVVIVKEAQHLSRQLDQLANYVEQPTPTTILVFAYKYKTPDGRSKTTKLLKKKAVYMESKPIYENKVGSFIEQQLAAMQYSIHPNATRMLVEYLGTDLGKINNELSKLTVVVQPGENITPAVVEKNIGISKDYNNFELRKAIGSRDVIKVHKIINYFEDNPKDNPVVLTTAQLYSLFSQLLKVHASTDKSQNALAKAAGVSPYFVKEIIAAARNYPMKYCSRAIKLIRDLDVKSKGVGSASATSPDLLKETVVKIMAH